MALWTVMDVNIVGSAVDSRIVRVRLSDSSSVVNKELAPAETIDLRSQIEKLLKSNPQAASMEVSIGGEVYEIDIGGARSLLAKLAPDQRRILGMSSRAFPPIAIGVILVLLAGWGASYVKFRSAMNASNVEMMKLGAEIIQHPRTNPGLLSWAIDALARDAEIAISPERRQQMVQVLATHPETSFETIIELYGTEFPEFNALAGRLETYEFWTEKKSAGPKDASGEKQKADSQPQTPAPSTSRKEIIDRLPEEKDGPSSSQSQTVYPSTPGQVINKQ
jgi:hypothetical protein